MQPLFFDAQGTSLFGWIHPAGPAPTSQVGVLVCSPWGREELSAHLSLRSWAQQMAQAGLPVMRFDYPCTGDSGDLDGGLDLAAWVASVHAAIDAFKRLCGLTQVCLLGLRLGATLASLAAVERADVAALIAVAPVVKGRAYLRELTALQMAQGSVAPSSPAAASDRFQSGGFALPAATRDALASIDLSALGRAVAPEVLVLDREELPAPPGWVQSLRELGAQVQVQHLPGYAAMMDDPHRAQVPQAMVEASLCWLAQRQAAWAPAPVPSPSPLAEPAPLAEPPAAMASVQWPASFAQGHGVIEEALFIAGTPAFGVLSRPASGPHPAHAIVLLNAGSTRHIGPSRLYVDLARHWASQGHAVLRLDLAGLGDSDPRPGAPHNQTYPLQALDDVAAAVNHLQTHLKISSCHAVGLCAGAYHAFKAARTGLPLRSVVQINPLIFFNAEGIALDAGWSPQKIHSAASSYRQSMLSPAKWLKLIKGQAHIKVLAQVLLHRAGMRLARHGRDMARWLGRPLKDDLAGELAALAQRGIQLHFVFSRHDPGVALLAEQGGRAVSALQRAGRMGITTINEADHVFTDERARAQLVAELCRLMDGFAADGARSENGAVCG